jgi:hypothetical protein
MTLLLLALLAADAQAAGPGLMAGPLTNRSRSEGKEEPEVPGEIPAAASIHARKRPPERLRVDDHRLVSPGTEVSADDVVDEILDEFASDVARLGAAQVGPILLQRVRVSENMNPAYAGILEARLAGAVFRAASVAMVRCFECTATRSRIEDGAYVLSRGITRREEAQGLAKKYGARTFLDVALTLRDKPASVVMDVEMVRTEDASIAFAEDYRMDADHALLYRGADRGQYREEKLRELEARIERRPRFAHLVEFGTMLIHASPSGTIWGGVARYAIAEQFGETRRFLAGISAGGFLNTENLTGGILSMLLQTRMGEDNPLGSEFHLGAHAGVFMTGNAGNTPLVGGGFRWQVGLRIGIHGSLTYMVPFQLRGKGDEYGGVCPELGVGFIWQ